MERSLEASVMDVRSSLDHNFWDFFLFFNLGHNGFFNDLRSTGLGRLLARN